MKKDKVKNIITDFEANKIDIMAALESIYKITQKRLEESRLRNYWRSESLDELIASITYEEYSNWKNIDDEEAIRLLGEIREYIGDGEILSRNTEALERRYKKPVGTVSDLIFHNEFSNNKILSKLKEDSVTLL